MILFLFCSRFYQSDKLWSISLEEHPWHFYTSFLFFLPRNGTLFEKVNLVSLGQAVSLNKIMIFSSSISCSMEKFHLKRAAWLLGKFEVLQLLTAEKAMAPHSSTLAWKIPWTEEPGRLQSMGSLRVGHDWATSLFAFHFHALEKEMATHSGVLAWRIPETEEPSGLPSMGSHKVGHDWSDLA